jgi:hypothetical protein
MVDTAQVLTVLLTLMRVVVFGLALGLTLISFQAYREKKSQKLQFAFVGFAFISMGVAISSVITQVGTDIDPIIFIWFQIVQTVPFIIGFSMLYLSLYR